MKDLWKSKKFRAALLNVALGSAAIVAQRHGLDISTPEIGLLLAPLSAYIVGQGMADWGKESGKELKK